MQMSFLANLQRARKKNSIIYFKIVQIAPSCQGFFFRVTAAGPTADGMGQKWKEITMHFHIFAFAALHPGPMDDASNNFSRQNHQPLLAASFGVVGWECQSSQVTSAHAGCKMGTPVFGLILFLLSGFWRILMQRLRLCHILIICHFSYTLMI